MKIILTLSALLFLVFVSKAQDTALPQGNSRIHLYSGKTIKHVRLWKIDTLKVEYVAEGNLGDVRTSDVKKIETPRYLITFDEEHAILKRNYDLIIPYYGDSIWCFVKKESETEILYVPVGSEREKIVSKSSVKFYMQWTEQKTEKHEITASANQTGSQNDSGVSKNNSEVSSGTIYILNEKIGKIIDIGAKNTFNLFEEISSEVFLHAIIYYKSDSSNEKIVKIYLNDGSVKERPISENEIDSFRKKINKRTNIERNIVAGGVVIGVLYFLLISVANK